MPQKTYRWSPPLLPRAALMMFAPGPLRATTALGSRRGLGGRRLLLLRHGLWRLINERLTGIEAFPHLVQVVLSRFRGGSLLRLGLDGLRVVRVHRGPFPEESGARHQASP